jgi:hypothetical protein
MTTFAHVHAEFVPAQKKFRVQFKTGKHRWVELMTIARFLRYAKTDDKPLVIGGTIKFEEDNNQAEKQVREYLRRVAVDYMRRNGYKI